MTPHGGARPGAGRKRVADDERTVQVAVRLSPEMLAEVDVVAEATGMDRSDTVRALLGSALANWKRATARVRRR